VVEYNEFQPETPAAQKTSRAKWIALIGCGGSLALVACLVIFIGAIFLIVFGAIRSSDVYTEAVEIAQGSEAVSAALGQPVETGWFVSGSINTSGSSGDADIIIPLSGPIGKGDLVVIAFRRNRNWEFSSLYLDVEGGARIDLLAGR
jgi:hypothetical protein